MTSGASVWLYGSAARGDADCHSDRDILVVGTIALNDLDRLGVANASISRYSWTEMEGMATYGSLFLHHLRAEGKLLFEGLDVKGRLNRILAGAGWYTRARVDIRAFETMLGDIENAIAADGDVAFEISALATTVRHASILGCFLVGHPCFSRWEPVARFSRVAGFDGSREKFEKIYRHRLSRERGVPAGDAATIEDVREWMGHLQKIIFTLKDKANEIDA